jgi:membrane-associated phospholipid phosphatase
MTDSLRSGSNIALYSIAAGTAWARVEAEKHYPSDVLAALAVGNFVATLFNDTFLQPAAGNAMLSVWPGETGTEIVFSLSF